MLSTSTVWPDMVVRMSPGRWRCPGMFSQPASTPMTLMGGAATGARACMVPSTGQRHVVLHLVIPSAGLMECRQESKVSPCPGTMGLASALPLFDDGHHGLRSRSRGPPPGKEFMPRLGGHLRLSPPPGGDVVIEHPPDGGPGRAGRRDCRRWAACSPTSRRMRTLSPQPGRD